MGSAENKKETIKKKKERKKEIGKNKPNNRSEDRCRCMEKSGPVGKQSDQTRSRAGDWLSGKPRADFIIFHALQLGVWQLICADFSIRRRENFLI